MFGACPRAGSILLETKYHRRLLMNTQCKTWGCISCRERMKSLFRARVSSGVSRTGRCAFMTITYKEGSERLSRVGCVARDWRALWRRFQKYQPEMLGMEWLRVMELTQKGTPHHHVVIGPVKGLVRCWSRDRFRIDRYRRLFDSCECLAHKWAREWFAVTGDAYIVHATEVVGAEGAGAYMAKYLQKEFDGARAEELGMARRWSSSRGWPGSGRLRLAQTEKGGWRRTAWAPHHVGEDIAGGPADLMERTGDDLTRARSVESARRKFVAEVTGYVVDGGETVLRA